MFKAKVERDTKTRRTTVHKDRQRITKVHQNNWHERFWNDKLEQNSKGRCRISQCRSREQMEPRARPCMLPCKLTGSVVILADKNGLVHTFRQQSSFSLLWAVTGGNTQLFLYTLSCREWKRNQQLRETGSHRQESSAGILDKIQGFEVCLLVIYFSASSNILSSPRNQIIYQRKLDFQPLYPQSRKNISIYY